MNTQKLGIWMDHREAHLIEFTMDPMETTTIYSKFTHETKVQSLKHGENNMHTKEQHQQAEFYKALGAIIKKYREVLLFGPTDAKHELQNMLDKDHLFADIKITVEQADKMTENQQHAFVRAHYIKK